MAKTAEKKPGKVVHFAGEKGKEPTGVSPMRSFEDMERMFDDFMSRNWMRPSRWEFPTFDWMPPFERTLSPKVDIIDRDNELVLKAQIPGVKKEDLNLTVTDNMVTLEGTSSHEEKEERDNYYRRECARGSFTRSIPLPCDVESAKATATFEDGMLELHLPKMTKTKRHTVEIK